MNNAIPSRHPAPALCLLSLAWWATFALGCSKDGGSDAANAAPLAGANGELAFFVVVPPNPMPGLTLAAEDFLEAGARLLGGDAAPAGRVVSAVPRAPALVGRVDVSLSDALGPEGYRIRGGREGGHARVFVDAATETGVMYGIYDLIDRLGVRYFHPEETFWPVDPQATLPLDLEVEETPHYRWRGFHEHTQHPTEWSDYLLRPDPSFRPYVTRYLRWYARNRQNTLSWHMLKTVDLDGWLPWIEDIIAEAAGLGIEVGMVLSFLDEQQNNFKVVDDERLDPQTGQIMADDLQVRTTLDRLAAAGFRFFALQIGSSEFTKPDEGRMVGLLDLAATHLAAMDPPVRAYAWIHTTCSLKDENGDYFFHLPNRSVPEMGAWVHTTMFYTLDSPAPVYDCESFSHHLDFLETEHQRREQIYFPESAWWLGFDNNTPVTLPITGWSRHHDIRNVLAPFQVRGHVTFTTGREWLYWQYDHHLTRVTWDADVDWERYLDWLAPVYGERGQQLADVLSAWADLQVRHFYEENPEIYFYYAGELQQDEIGEQAGIIARRPKIAFRRVVAMDDAAFEAWRARDFDMLHAMLEEYSALFESLPASPGLGSSQASRLYHEAWETLRLSVRRIEHAIAVYAGTIAVRQWEVARRAEEATPALRATLLAEAEGALERARAISADAIATVAVIEGVYRYPLDILAEPKPESLTSYPFGYLWETRTGHFWTRRDDQLATLIEERFETVPELWTETPLALLYAEDSAIRLLEPTNPLARDVIAGFVPRLLLAVLEGERLVIAQDYNENFLPDRGTEVALRGARSDGVFTGTSDNFGISVRDDAGNLLGELILLDPRYSVTWEAALPTLVTLHAEFPSRLLIDLILDNFGIDESGVVGLLRQVFGIPRGQPLPARLPVVFALDLAQGPDTTTP